MRALIVPSGVSSRSAICSWVNPPKKESSNACRCSCWNLLKSRTDECASFAKRRFVCRCLVFVLVERFFGGDFFAQFFHPLANPQPIYRFVPSDHDCPGKRTASIRVEGRGFPPDVSEALL